MGDRDVLRYLSKLVKRSREDIGESRKSRKCMHSRLGKGTSSPDESAGVCSEAAVSVCVSIAVQNIGRVDAERKMCSRSRAS